MRVKTGNIAAAFGKGIFAGVAGTAVMTISSTVEMKLQERPGENRLYLLTWGWHPQRKAPHSANSAPQPPDLREPPPPEVEGAHLLGVRL